VIQLSLRNLEFCCYADVFLRRVNPEDEVFADPADLDLDLLGGMDLPQPVPTGSDRSRDQTTSQQQKQTMSGDTTNDGAAGAGAQAAAGAVTAWVDECCCLLVMLHVWFLAAAPCFSKPASVCSDGIVSSVTKYASMTLGSASYAALDVVVSVLLQVVCTMSMMARCS
jgi:hypothetical protein